VERGDQLARGFILAGLDMRDHGMDEFGGQPVIAIMARVLGRMRGGFLVDLAHAQLPVTGFGATLEPDRYQRKRFALPLIT
jgi:hypothetical protein